MSFDFVFRRVRAIASVCFSESIRRRVLWITPLAILGVIVVSQLQKPIDEQDAIRQTTKFCLFATGLVVTLGSIILACTNLPREIENRVIFTVVTKPTTRLEIVLGKILGFAMVSAAILLIMGIFSWSYLQFRAITLQRDIKYRLNTAGLVDPIIRPTLQHYVDAGLLNAKTIALPADLNIYGRMPVAGDSRKYFTSDGSALFPFVLPSDLPTDGMGLIIHAKIGYDIATAPKPTTQPVATGPHPFNMPSPLVASTRPAGEVAKGPTGPPTLNVQVYDQNQNSTSVATQLNGGKPIVLSSPDGTEFEIPITAADATTLAKLPLIYIALLGGNPDVQYWAKADSVQIIIPNTAKPAESLVLSSSNPYVASEIIPVMVGRQGTQGQQLKGQADGNGSVGIYAFNKVMVSNDSPTVPIEVRFGIEHANDEGTDSDVPAKIALEILNRKTGEISDAGTIIPENNRTAYATVPAAAVANGDFNLIVRCLSNEQWINLNNTSVAIVQSESPFAFNLFKSLLILWLLTILVISISIFCSTFLSWPIAVVLTLVILLGHWGVQELGDAASAGLGRQFVTDFGVRDPAASQALSSTVEQLNKLLGVFSSVLPDIGSFAATEDIERGVSVPFFKINDAFWMMFGFGVPLTVLAYITLKNKEVAP